MTIASAPENDLVQITGPNFSGRSEALLQRLLGKGSPGSTFFIGPYAESGLSGIATSVSEELHFYGASDDRAGTLGVFGSFLPPPTAKVATLSGGQQVMLALECVERSGRRFLGVDTALEQLDEEHRVQVAHWLRVRAELSTVLVDNRWTEMHGWQVLPAGGTAPRAWSTPLADLARPTSLRIAPEIGVEQLGFAYARGPQVFDNVDLQLVPGRAWRLHGPNGSGKSTFLKLLTGVLAPRAGRFRADGEAYEPSRHGNRLVALATQDPDQQWVGTTVRQDMARRMRSAHHLAPVLQHAQAMLDAVQDVFPLDVHLLDLPKALRKRISWLWALSGAMPWLALDEPTLGQDALAVEDLAAALRRLLHGGWGVLFVSHDRRLADLLPHHTLAFGSGGVSVQLSGSK